MGKGMRAGKKPKTGGGGGGNMQKQLQQMQACLLYTSLPAVLQTALLPMHF